MHLVHTYFSVTKVLFPPTVCINFDAVSFCCTSTRLYISSASFKLSPASRMKRGLLILDLMRRTLRKILLCIEDEEISSLYNLPDDVKEGHFAVHTVDDGESRRSVIELRYLAHPGFLKLLQVAEEEFGFRQKGILAVPCGYGDLQKLLERKENS